MRRKLKSVKGFTLAELLIVVAIIGVLVAIAIPIFTSQLERSREAVDLSDVRSAYAEVMMAAITGDTSAKYTKDSSQTIWKSEGKYSIKVTPLKQQREGWQTPLPITIGGVSSSDTAHWIGTPGANGYCEITYCPPSGNAAEYVKFEWSGGSSGGGGNTGGDSGSGENPGGGSGDSTGGGETPSDGNSWNSIVGKYGLVDWPTAPTNEIYSWKEGQIVRFEGTYYISLETNQNLFNQDGYCNPMSENKRWSFAKVSNRFYTPKDLDAQGNLPNSSYGDIFIDDDANRTAYVYKADYKGQARPNSTNSGQWVKIIKAY